MTPTILPDLLHEFRRHRVLAERAVAELDDEAFFARPAPQVNPVASIVKHLAGNLVSRWTEFLTSDGEKPTRNRDNEFLLALDDTRERLMNEWNRGWEALLTAADTLTDADLDKTVTIRGEPHTVYQALIRGLTHIAYHTGQILYLVRLLKPNAQWQTIAPGQSAAHRPSYRQPSSS
jgi:uncharacterized damage-inducible protein DinB